LSQAPFHEWMKREYGHLICPPVCPPSSLLISYTMSPPLLFLQHAMEDCIIYFLDHEPPSSPPRSLLSLMLTCRLFYNLVHPSNNDFSQEKGFLPRAYFLPLPQQLHHHGITTGSLPLMPPKLKFIGRPHPPQATADTRTNHTIGLGHALILHHHTGVLPSSASLQDSLPALPLSDPLAAMSMPEAWVRGAILVRINSLIRGHSAVRWELLEKMVTLLHEDITPFVPLRGSISASGGTSV
jgi:hypothetical protein